MTVNFCQGKEYGDMSLRAKIIKGGNVTVIPVQATGQIAKLVEHLNRDSGGQTEIKV